MSTNRMLPIGVSNFRKLIEHKNPAGIGYAFIDKTLLIREILFDGSEVIILPRPRRFGKTLNLSMLQHFFAATVRDKSTTGLFDNLAISNHQDCMQHQGQYPVIFITFKEAKYTCLENLKQGLKVLIADLFNDHDYLLNSDKLSSSEKNFFDDILNRNADEADLPQSLLYLVKFIFKHYGAKPFILIDEYDIPIQEAFIQGYYKEAVYFLRALFSAVLKDNPYITKAVLTGIVRISKESLFSGLNNIMIYSILSDDDYSSYFGFLETEVDDLLQEFNLPIDKALIKSWYNGYKFANNDNIYNPWSILNCIKKKGDLQAYWINTSSNDLAKMQIETASNDVRGKLKALMQGQEITETITESFVFEDLGKGQISLWSLLVLTGYLKVVTSSPHEQDYIGRLTIPNKEIMAFYSTTVKRWISKALGMDWFNELLTALTNGEIERFSTKLNQFILESASYFDTASNIQESFYHGLTLGLVAGLKNDYIIKSNRESGLGRYDLALIPHDRQRIGIIMEFKAKTEQDSLKIIAEQALTQVLSKNYQTELKQAEINKILAIGIAFSKNQVYVVHQFL